MYMPSVYGDSGVEIRLFCGKPGPNVFEDLRGLRCGRAKFAVGQKQKQRDVGGQYNDGVCMVNKHFGKSIDHM